MDMEEEDEEKAVAEERYRTARKSQGSVALNFLLFFFTLFLLFLLHYRLFS